MNFLVTNGNRGGAGKARIAVFFSSLITPFNARPLKGKNPSNSCDIMNILQRVLSGSAWPWSLGKSLPDRAWGFDNQLFIQTI
jgi:hypothetical protein